MADDAEQELEPVDEEQAYSVGGNLVDRGEPQR
jgi:hypothetical protein